MAAKQGNSSALINGIAIVGAAWIITSALDNALDSADGDGRQDASDYDSDKLPDAERATMTRQQSRIIADAVDAAIYEDSTFWWDPVFGSWTENEEEIIRQMTLDVIRTTGDVLQIIEAYGERGTYATPNLNLVQAVQKYAGADGVATINKAYQDRRINVRL